MKIKNRRNNRRRAHREEENEERPEVICRICHGPDNDGGEGGCIEPCLCKGSIARVHQLCLEQWLNIKGDMSTKCELCLFKYKVKYIYKYPLFESIGIWIQENLLIHDVLLIFLMIIRLLLVTVETFFVSPRISQIFQFYNLHSLVMLGQIAIIIFFFCRRNGLKDIIKMLLTFSPAACFIQIFIFYDRLRRNNFITLVGLTVRAFLASVETLVVCGRYRSSNSDLPLSERMSIMIAMMFKTVMASIQLLCCISRIYSLDRFSRLIMFEKESVFIIQFVYTLYLIFPIYEACEYFEDWWQFWQKDKRIVLAEHWKKNRNYPKVTSVPLMREFDQRPYSRRFSILSTLQ